VLPNSSSTNKRWNHHSIRSSTNTNPNNTKRFNGGKERIRKTRTSPKHDLKNNIQEKTRRTIQRNLRTHTTTSISRSNTRDNSRNSDSMILELILKTFYFMMPAYFANMAPVICKKMFKFLAKPIDFGKTLNGKPIFGKNKTWRGLIVAVMFGIIIAYIQFLLKDTFAAITIINYSNWFWIGLLLGLGAILGDLAKSFFKRRVGVKSGQPWIPFDQIDYTLGAILFVSLIYFPGWNILITALAMNFLLHIIVNHIAYWTHIRNEKW